MDNAVSKTNRRPVWYWLLLCALATAGLVRAIVTGAPALMIVGGSVAVAALALAAAWAWRLNRAANR